MNVTRENIIVIVGAVVAVLLQIIVAPNIAIFSIMPNFIMAFVLVVAMVRPREEGPVLPFVLGLTADLLGGGPVGGMAFLFVLVSFLASRAFLLLDNDTLFMPLAFVVISSLVVEMLYAALLMALGLSVSPLDAFLLRGLPCALYDSVVGLVLYPILLPLLAGASQPQPGTPRLR